MSHRPATNSFKLMPNNTGHDILNAPINKLVVFRKPSDNRWWSITLCLEHIASSGQAYVQIVLARNVDTVGYYNPFTAVWDDFTTNVQFRVSNAMCSIYNASPVFEIACDPRTTTLNAVWGALHSFMPFYSVSRQSPSINHGWVRFVITGLARHGILASYALDSFDSDIEAQMVNWSHITWPPYPGLVISNPSNA